MKQPNKTSLIGYRYGLSVVLNTTTSDYYFSTGDHVGFIVHIFSPSDFPDAHNGALSQMIVDRNSKSYFKLMPRTLQSKAAIEKYSPVMRGCLFEHEIFGEYAGHYSFSDCLLKCKLKTIITACDCMPFFLPTNFPDNTTAPIKCTIADNKCLHRWKCKCFNARILL